MVMRQAFAGMTWSLQFYHYDVPRWLRGDTVPPPEARKSGRNSGCRHLNNHHIIAMPDKWEYPWYASWDLAFHCVVLAHTDPAMAKGQLLLLSREWYMHPNGQLPAYEWNFDDVNPPVQAWAALAVFRIDGAGGISIPDCAKLKALSDFRSKSPNFRSSPCRITCENARLCASPSSISLLEGSYVFSTPSIFGTRSA
jgi:hypothetical protein